MSNLNNFETLKNLIKGLTKPQTESDIATHQYLMNQFNEAYPNSLNSLEKLHPVVPPYGSDKTGKIREGYLKSVQAHDDNLSKLHEEYTTVKDQYYQMLTEV